VEKMKALANELYNSLLDMDNADYNETQAEDLKALAEDLELLQKQGNGALLNVIKMLVEN
jgi:hypothetical protein